MSSRTVRAITVGVAVALIATVSPAEAVGQGVVSAPEILSKPPKTQVEPSVPGTNVTPRVQHPPAMPTYRPTGTSLPGASGAGTVTLPGAGTNMVEVPGTVLSLGAARGKAAQARSTPKLQAQMLGAAARERAGILGLLVRLGPAGGGAAAAESLAPAKVPISVDYSSFADAFGGDWASRLQLVALPACAVDADPSAREACAAPVALATKNDYRTKTLTADAPTSVDGEPALIGTQALAAGDQGDFTATPLAASSSWATGLQTGNFSWSYPIPAVPVPGGLAPKLAVTYSSQSVDGRTQTSNNQTSWLGEGQDLAAGFIERSYASCRDVPGDAGADGDLCWKTDNATLSFGGQSSELLRKTGSDEWRAKDDQGWRIRHLDGTNAPWVGNGDNNNEYWELTDQDGTRYYFGREKRFDGDTASSGSAWTVPVYGGPDDGCTDVDGCAQAWRWNLDYVVDLHGNSMTYNYQQELNKYGANNNTEQLSYVRGGYLKEIEYGQIEKAEQKVSPTARVLFETEERCDKIDFDCDPAKLNATNARHWPDVPFDQICDDEASCAKVKSPAFFSRKRLLSITTQVQADSGYAAVDRIDFKQKFVPNDGTGPSQWLEKITRTGEDGGSTPLNPVEFYGSQMPNRVEVGGAALLYKWRVNQIKTETGGRISVTYSGADCEEGNMPASVHDNSKRCFPVYWQPTPFSDLQRYWFHKYVVTEVKEDDYIEAVTAVLTRYSYLGGGAWHYDDNQLIKEKYRTWGEWRGYGEVEVRKGNPTELGTTQSFDNYTYLRGMHGDRQPDGGTRSRTVTNDDGGSITDYNRYSGFLYEHVQRNGPGGAIVSAEVHRPWLSEKTAGTDSDPAKIRRTAETRTRKQDVGTTSFFRTTTTTDYDQYGLPVSVHEAGADANPSDSVCTHTKYGRDNDKWLLSPVSQVTKLDLACDTKPLPADLVSDERYAFDGEPFGTAPTKGNVTTTQTYSGGSPVSGEWRTTARSQYDARGRVISTTDGVDNTTTTTYVPAGSTTDHGPLTRTVVTNPMSHTTVTDLNRGRGVPRKIVDANGKVTAASYDALGRVSAVWMPGRVQGVDNPDTKFAYGVKNANYSYQQTSQLLVDGTYADSYEIYDPLLRPVQSQALSADLRASGRVLTGSVYDSRGQVVRKLGAYLVTGSEPSSTYYSPTVSAVLDNHRFVYDGAGRVTDDIYEPKAVEKWRTKTSYDANRVQVDPPAGGTPTTQSYDARDQVVARISHLGDSPAAPGQSTTYTYDAAGRIKTMSDPAGNEWRWGYDLRGNQITASDPDKGNATMVYDNSDRLITTTDARGTVTHTTYDDLGRKTALYDGATANADKLRAKWAYDPAGAKGQPASSVRYSTPGDTGTAYTTEVTGYTDDYQPLGTKVTIPSVAGETTTTTGGSLAGEYTTNFTYYDDGTLHRKQFAAAPGLPAERVYYERDKLGQPILMGGTSSLAFNTTYSPYGELLQAWGGVESGKFGIQTWFYDDGTRRLGQHIVSNQAVANYINDVKYTYDATGNVLKVADTGGAGSADIQCFLYDDLRQLEEAWAIASGSCGSTRPTSTSVMGGPAPYWSSYTYDKIGNRKSETERTKSGTTITTTTNTFGYPQPGPTTQPQNGFGGPHAAYSHTKKVGSAAAVTTDFEYDAAGNMTVRGSQTLAWDSEGKLATNTSTAGANSNLYDADGNRLIRKDPDGTLTLYLDGTEIRLAGTTKTSQRWYEFGGQTIATRTSAGVFMLAADHHGTGQVQVNGLTAAVTKRRFDPFGAPRSGINTPGWNGDRGFLDKPLDDTGLVQVGARYYDRTLGRFISVDPLLMVDDPRQANAYQYANNNPVSISDPTGLGYDPDGFCPPSVCGGSEDGGSGGDPGGGSGAGTGGGGGEPSGVDLPASPSGSSGAERHEPDTIDILKEALVSNAPTGLVDASTMGGEGLSIGLLAGAEIAKKKLKKSLRSGNPAIREPARESASEKRKSYRSVSKIGKTLGTIGAIVGSANVYKNEYDKHPDEWAIRRHERAATKTLFTVSGALVVGGAAGAACSPGVVLTFACAGLGGWAGGYAGGVAGDVANYLLFDVDVTVWD